MSAVRKLRRKFARCVSYVPGARFRHRQLDVWKRCSKIVSKNNIIHWKKSIPDIVKCVHEFDNQSLMNKFLRGSQIREHNSDKPVMMKRCNAKQKLTE